MSARREHPHRHGEVVRPNPARRRGWAGAWVGSVFLATTLAGAPGVARADDPPFQPAANSVPTPSGKPQILTVPVPLSDPALGSGLTLVGALLYTPQGSGGTWTTGGGGLYTTGGSYAAFVGQKAHLDEDRFRLTAAVGYASLNLKFYGLGGLLASRGLSIGINQTGLGVYVQGLREVAPHTYVGLEYLLIDANTTLAPVRAPSLPLPGQLPGGVSLPGPIQIPQAQLKLMTSALGIAGEYDGRDSEYGTRSGIYVKGVWRFASPTIGSKFEYNKMSASANLYVPVAADTVIAARANVCVASQGTPFYDLCLYGSDNSLRGYATGQYRDNAMGAAQVELRQHLFWRLGAVVFAGVGGTAPGANRFGEAHFLPDYGVGVRFLASKVYRVNLSIDFAEGRHSNGLYVYIGESF